MIKLLPSILALLACSCYYLLKHKPAYKTMLWVFYGLLFISGCYFVLDKVIYRVNNPEVWDFTSFYLWGKVAATGHNFYLPENSQLIFNSAHLPALNYDTFTADIINVGFLYPPPTILYFAPLGLLPYKTAMVLWTLFNLVFLFASIKLTYELFLKKDKLNGFLLVLILFFISSPVRSTIFFSQTNFIVIYLLLLMRKYSHTKYAGIFLALAIFTKPYTIVFFIYFLIKKNWGAIIYFILSVIALLGITAAIFGTAPFVSYIFDNPTHRLPLATFLEEINQSLHSVLLRAGLISLDKPLVFITILLTILVLAFIYLMYLQKKKLDDFIWVTLLLVGLLIYPGTLLYYGVLLLFIVFQFFDEKQPLGFNWYLTIPIVTITFALCTNNLFIAICFLLCVIILKTFLSDFSVTKNGLTTISINNNK